MSMPLLQFQIQFIFLTIKIVFRCFQAEPPPPFLTGRNLEKDQAGTMESRLGKGGEGEGDRTERMKERQR